jgi:Zn-dependent peptidase ImmA (M78 family)
MDRPTKTINEIIKGKATITSETALQLELTLGINADFWSNLESAYRQHLARQKARQDMSSQASWVDLFPIRDLVKHGLIPDGQSKQETLESLLRFFRVSSPSAWRNHWEGPQAAFRASPTYDSDPQSVAAWLRWGEIAASEIKCEPWDRDRFHDTLVKVRQMTRVEPISLALEEAVGACRQAGVAVVLTPELKGTRLNGAARWISSSKALIQLSLRHKSDDQLWYTFMHEAGHLITSTRKVDYVDSPPDDDSDLADDEHSADVFARELLIPDSAYGEFLFRADFSARAVQEFAREIRVSPGVVVGRLQRDRHVPFTNLNRLKKRVQFANM